MNTTSVRPDAAIPAKELPGAELLGKTYICFGVGPFYELKNFASAFTVTFEKNMHGIPGIGGIARRLACALPESKVATQELTKFQCGGGDGVTSPKLIGLHLHPEGNDEASLFYKSFDNGSRVWVCATANNPDQFGCWMLQVPPAPNPRIHFPQMKQGPARPSTELSGAEFLNKTYICFGIAPAFGFSEFASAFNVKFEKDLPGIPGIGGIARRLSAALPEQRVAAQELTRFQCGGDNVTSPKQIGCHLHPEGNDEGGLYYQSFDNGARAWIVATVNNPDEFGSWMLQLPPEPNPRIRF